MIIKFKRKTFASLEKYEELDDKRVAKLTDAQKRMLLEDERNKARRNTSKIVSEYGKRGAEEGAKRGKKKGAKWGAGIGSIGGAIAASKIPLRNGSNKHKLLKLAAGGAIGALGGSGLGYLIGKSSGEAAGRSKGQAEGRKVAKKGGHDEVEVMTKHARRFDDYARKHKKKDVWEIGIRNQLKEEKKAAAQAAARRRAEELERRRVAAVEREARARETEAGARDRDSWTNRYKYLNESGKSGRTDWTVW